MRHECLAVTARLEAGREGRLALVIDDPRCTDCVGCFWRAPNKLDLPDCLDLGAGQPLTPDRPVVLRLPVDAALVAALVLYGLPLAALLVGASLGAAHGDGGAVVGAVAGLGAAALGMRLLGARLERRICARLTLGATVGLR